MRCVKLLWLVGVMGFFAASAARAIDEVKPPEACVTAAHADGAAVSVYAEELAKQHPLLGASRVARALPWLPPSPLVEVGHPRHGQPAFQTEAMPFGRARASSWRVHLHPSGEMSIELLVAPEDDSEAFRQRFIDWAKSTIDAGMEEGELDGGRHALMLVGILDRDLAPSSTTCAPEGRRLYLERVFQGLTGRTPESDLLAAVPHPGRPLVPAVIDGNLRFGTSLGKPLAREALSAGKTFFYSPNVIASAWAMAANGARGTTLAQMLSVYGNDLSAEQLLNGTGALAQRLQQGSAGSVNLANALYSNADVHVRPEFQELIRVAVRGLVETRDFGLAASLEAMNGFVSTNTNGMIPKLLESLDPRGVSMLLSAIGVKVKWSTKFDKALTRTADFNAFGTVHPVPMMHRTGTFRFMQDDLVRGISLATEGGKIAVDFYLPRLEGIGPDGLAAMLDLGRTQRWARQFHDTRDVKVWMPRLKVRYRSNLIPTMQRLPVPVTAPFLAGADFSRLASEPSFIGLFLTEAALELDEEGAAAAAGAAVGNLRELARRSEELNFNRPYLIVFRDVETGEVEFAGAIAQP